MTAHGSDCYCTGCKLATAYASNRKKEATAAYKPDGSTPHNSVEAAARNYVCPECHATIAFEGDLPEDCLRCGAALSQRDIEPAGTPRTPGQVPDAAKGRELLHAIESAHAWLERVEEYREPGHGYFGLDHRLGQNVEGCTYCHAAAVLHGLAEPILDA